MGAKSRKGVVLGVRDNRVTVAIDRLVSSNHRDFGPRLRKQLPIPEHAGPSVSGKNTVINWSEPHFETWADYNNFLFKFKSGAHSTTGLIPVPVVSTPPDSSSRLLVVSVRCSG